MSVLFQDFNHYQLLVKDNIKVGDISSLDGEDRMHSVSRLAGADTFINSLPEGFETQLGKWFERGQELSIGQWQKLALARGFMRDAPILIFDEPTSHLDARAESEIFKAIEEFRKDKIVIVISHRLKTVRRADVIIVLHKGAVVETGNHDELMGINGLYANLFNLQAESYKDLQPQMNADGRR